MAYPINTILVLNFGSDVSCHVPHLPVVE